MKKPIDFVGEYSYYEIRDIIREIVCLKMGNGIHSFSKFTELKGKITNEGYLQNDAQNLAIEAIETFCGHKFH